MKKSSLKLLLALYTEDEKPLWLDYSQLEFILPKLSYAGLRSLISQMKKKSLLHTEYLMSNTRICLTNAGKRELETQFPAFSSRLKDWQGNISCMVFLTAAKTDKQFRYLRNLLISAACIQVSRGIYAYPGEFPESLIKECKNSYQNSVIIFNINKCIFGDLQTIMMQKESVAGLADFYSGISKETSHLLSLNEPLSSFTHSQKEQFSTVFDRFFNNLKNDKGLMTYYFPQVVSAQELLLSLQQVIAKK